MFVEFELRGEEGVLGVVVLAPGRQLFRGGERASDEVLQVSLQAAERPRRGEPLGCFEF